MADPARDFHEQWLGMVQPVEGLVVSLPTLLGAQVAQRLPLEARDRLAALSYGVPCDDGVERLAVDLESLLFDDALLAFRRDDFDGGELGGGRLPRDLSLWVPEGRQEIVPTLALRRKEPADPGDDATPAARAGARYQLLVWRLPDGLDLDRPESTTGSWDYPPTAKLERLLRHTRVTAGLLTNGGSLRLMVAPHGESSGWMTFHVGDMVTVGGRPILDALVMLLGRPSFFGRAPSARLPALLEDSRKRQADVTEQLADQVFGALGLLLAGFEAAAQRDGSDALDDARRLGDDPIEGDHLYGGLLTVLLRLVFLLYAEDRGLVPIEHPLYAEHYSVLGLFDQLQADAGEFPDSMDRRFGAWDRLVALFRAVWLGVEHDDLRLPPRGGRLFDPNRYPFLEGWPRGGSAPVRLASARAAVRVPSVDDATVYGVLRRLLVLDGQRLSYRALDVEQIGSVYEALMGYHVVQVFSPAVCLKPNRFWLESSELLEVPPSRRAVWLQEQAGLARAMAQKVAKATKDLADPEALAEALQPFRQARVERAEAGRLVLQPGSERRRTSSHYTPRSLSGPIVRRTLEPLLAAMGEEPTSEQLLELKICDPAMGSGAFLVEACRYLADRVVAAWTREGRLGRADAPNGEPAAGRGPAADSSDARDDVVVRARRLVAQRCLYGVDKNRFAVDLAKLSLWLETLSRDLPFTFLDHALRWGDSLVGLDFRQIRGFHWQPEGQDTLASEALDEALDEAIALRQQILDLAGQGEDAQREKERLLRDADDALNHARLIGDLVVGAFFAHDRAKDRALELAERLTAVHLWLQEGGGGTPPAKLLQLQRQIRERVPVFHWMLELPEIFYADRPDPLDHGRVNHAAYIDAFIGNPPFLGGKSISTNHGDAYSAWLAMIHQAGKNGDLSAHFFRLADRLLGKHGTLGLIATNTIAQGDTRLAGLRPLVTSGLEIYEATRTLPWPGAAAVTVSVVHLAKGHPVERLEERRLDDVRVEAINSRLRPKPERAEPETLANNQNLSFQGTIVVGIGFVLTPAERDALIARDRKNADRIFPYLGGEEINSSPTQDFHRYVINFGAMSLAEAEQWPDLIGIVRENVKPERDRVKRKAHREKWWHFGDKRPALYEALAPLDRCLVTSRVTKHLNFSFQPTSRVFADRLYVFPLRCHTAFTAMQSRVHSSWAWLLSSTLEERLNYSGENCFETFPFPKPDPRAELPELEAIGEQLYDTRARYLVDTEQGLTQCYNRLKDPHDDDPRVVELRRLHLAMDRAVLHAYGWGDIAVPPYTTPETEAEHRALETFEDEVIDRLFQLNAERAKEERRLALAAAAAAKGAANGKGAKKPGPRKKKGHAGQGGLFD